MSSIKVALFAALAPTVHVAPQDKLGLIVNSNIGIY